MDDTRPADAWTSSDDLEYRRRRDRRRRIAAAVLLAIFLGSSALGAILLDLFGG